MSIPASDSSQGPSGLPSSTERAVTEEFARPGGGAPTLERNGAEAPDARARPQPPPLLPGYVVLGELGRGGMGVVYKARQVAVNRVVALKMLLHGASASAAEVQRFRSEAESVARLDHPNIVPIYDVGEFQGQHYFSMKLVEGPSLERELRRLRGDGRAVARLAADVARAVHYAHQRGILHRDIKPSNVLLDADGRPHITDFGLAKQFEGDSSLTLTGVVVGTPNYMAPEQARAERPVSVAADVWGLGAVLYVLLTGRPPFDGPTPIAALQQALDEEPLRPRSLDGRIDRDLETICLRCLDRNPAGRYPSAEALADDRRWLAGEPIRARPVGLEERVWRWAKRRPALAATAALAVLALLGGAAGITVAWRYAVAGWTKAEHEGAEARARRQEAEATLYFSRIARADLERQLNQPALAAQLLDQCRPRRDDEPDRRGWEWHYLNGVLHADLLTIPEPHQGAVLDLAFSPDGRRLVTCGGTPYERLPDRVCVWEVWGESAGRCVREFSTAGLVHRAAHSDGGRRVVWSGADGRTRVGDVESGRVGPGPAPGPGFQPAYFSPDGQRFASCDDAGRLRVWDAADGRELFAAVVEKARVRFLGLGPGGRLLAATADNSLRWWDVDARRQLGAAPLDHFPRGRPAFSPDGTMVAIDDGAAKVFVFDAATGRVVQTLAGHVGFVQAVAFGPDGKSVATAGSDSTARLWSLASGTEQLVLRGHRGRVRCLGFHPSGNYLASGSEQPGDVKVWDLTRPQEHVSIPGRPPAGGMIEAVGFADDGATVHVLRQSQHLQSCSAATGRYLDGSPRRVDFLGKWITPAALAAFAPDGSRLAGVSSGDNRVVKLFDLPDCGERHRLGHSFEVLHVAFSHDGRRLAASAVDRVVEGRREVKVWDAATGAELLNIPCAPSPYFRANPKRSFGAVALSPDGGLLAHDEYDPPPGPAEKDQLTARVHVIDVATGQTRLTLSGFRGRVGCIAFSPDGRLLAVCDREQGVRVYDLAAGQWHPAGWFADSGDDPVWDMAFSPDGRRLAGVNRVQLLLWDVATGQKVLTLRGAPPRPGDNGINPRLAWSRDGRRLAASNWDGSVSIWDAADRQPPAAKRLLHQAAEERIRRP